MALTWWLLTSAACAPSSRPGAVVQDGVVVLQELRLLRVLDRNEHHRVAAR
jgi:hypothetical protein